MDSSVLLATRPGLSVGDAADDDEAANDWLLKAPMIAVGTVDRLRLLPVLVRWMSCLQPSQRDVASTYVISDMPTICTGADEFRQEVTQMALVT
jgi:hypothetical protein